MSCYINSWGSILDADYPITGVSIPCRSTVSELLEEETALEIEIAIQQKTLADPTLYARDPAAFDGAAAALQTAETALAETEEKWLALEVLREEVEGG